MLYHENAEWRLQKGWLPTVLPAALQLKKLVRISMVTQLVEDCIRLRSVLRYRVGLQRVYG